MRVCVCVCPRVVDVDDNDDDDDDDENVCVRVLGCVCVCARARVCAKLNTSTAETKHAISVQNCSVSRVWALIAPALHNHAPTLNLGRATQTHAIATAH